MAWIAYALGLASGLVTGWLFTVRAHGRRLRGFCHFEAANLIDPHGEA
ncbi:hypothetical protein [Streptomyces kaempferi]|uniref:Uncharacterized protein n=1 Tax=Streptomyces kaempferi TaxID=333725 RepID=A0ABW3XHQ5_9ACTN